VVSAHRRAAILSFSGSAFLTVAENDLQVVTAIHDVIDGPGVLDAQLASHETGLASASRLSIYLMTPWAGAARLMEAIPLARKKIRKSVQLTPSKYIFETRSKAAGGKGKPGEGSRLTLVLTPLFQRRRKHAKEHKKRPQFADEANGAPPKGWPIPFAYGLASIRASDVN
jgi:hypothetical protein